MKGNVRTFFNQIISDFSLHFIPYTVHYVPDLMFKVFRSQIDIHARYVCTHFVRTLTNVSEDVT